MSMIKKITEGIAKCIKSKFNEGYSIYTEAIEQGVKKPCFFILNKACKFDPLLGKRGKITYCFEIEVYGKSREEAEGILFELFTALGFIDTEEGKLMGKNMSFSLEGDMGIFKCEYTIIIQMQEEEYEYMEHLERKEV